MNFDHDEELLDWNMHTDDNFDDVLSEDQQNLNRMSKKELRRISEQEAQAKSPQEWVQFQPDHRKIERRSGDGDSVSSMDQGRHPSESRKTSNGSFQSNKDKVNRENSFSKYISQLENNGLSKFTVLNEDENDIEGYDASPVEFRGTLTTKESSYKAKSKTSCFCKFMHYFMLGMVSLGLGIIIGYFAAHSAISSEYDQLDQVQPVRTTASSRLFTQNATKDITASSFTLFQTFNTTTIKDN